MSSSSPNGPKVSVARVVFLLLLVLIGFTTVALLESLLVSRRPVRVQQHRDAIDLLGTLVSTSAHYQRDNGVLPRSIEELCREGHLLGDVCDEMWDLFVFKELPGDVYAWVHVGENGELDMTEDDLFLDLSRDSQTVRYSPTDDMAVTFTTDPLSQRPRRNYVLPEVLAPEE